VDAQAVCNVLLLATHRTYARFIFDGSKLTHDLAWPWDISEAYIRRHGPDSNFMAYLDVDHLLLVQALHELLADIS
jgi:hypothetical protein